MILPVPKNNYHTFLQNKSEVDTEDILKYYLLSICEISDNLSSVEAFEAAKERVYEASDLTKKEEEALCNLFRTSNLDELLFAIDLTSHVDGVDRVKEIEDCLNDAQVHIAYLNRLFLYGV